MECLIHPDRPKLFDHVSDEIHRGIRENRWSDWLPQERHLASELKVSRASLRLALATLRARGVLQSISRKGTRIVLRSGRGPGSSPPTATVNLLLPGEVNEIRPTVVQWIDELKAALATKGWRLRLLTAKACFGRSPEAPLRELFRRTPGDCWLVRLSTHPMQRWLQDSGKPVVIAGTCHPGVLLPFVDVDHRALSRHAAGAILAAGHRRIMLMVDEDEKAGDVESVRGFAEAANPALHPDLVTAVARHNGQVDGVVGLLRRMLQQAERPTALLSTQAIFCLTIWSYLASQGVPIPDSMSVVSQVGASYLSYLHPEPTCYRINQWKYAQLISRALDDAMTGKTGRRPYLLLPEFVPGASLARWG